MANYTVLDHVSTPFHIVPSSQMVIRRYRDFNRSHIEDLFKRGLFCRQLSDFDDDEMEGILEQPGETDLLRAGAAAVSSIRDSDAEGSIDPDEFNRELTEWSEIVRQKYFANCWRLGTDEKIETWRRYLGDEYCDSDGNPVNGIAIETTVGQLIDALPTEPADPDYKDERTGTELCETDMKNVFVGASTSDIFLGAVKYQDRGENDSEQPVATEEAVHFYKRKKFEFEKEFRLLVTPFEPSHVMKRLPCGRFLALSPEIDCTFRFLPINTVELVNRIILAPYANQRLRDEVESLLDNLGVSHGSGEDDDIEIIESNITGSPTQKTHRYHAEFGGQDNYVGTEEFLQEQHKSMVKENGDGWALIDLLTLNEQRADAMVEGYWHPAKNPCIKITEYGHPEKQAVDAVRYKVSSKVEDGNEEIALEKVEQFTSELPATDTHDSDS